MDSFAFWYKRKDQDEGNNDKVPLSATIQFNLWCECGWERGKIFSVNYKREKDPFLDIGFRIKNLACAEKLYFFLPLTITDRQKTTYIKDLGCKFKNTALVDAMFNANYITTISASSKTIDVNDGKKDQFRIYQLDILNDVLVSSFSNGTILTIKTDKILQNDHSSNDDTPNNMRAPDYYFRFRIMDCPMDFLIHKYSPPYKAFQSLFNTTYMIDFRYHNIRSLDNSLIEKFYEGKNEIVKIYKLHFFLMTKAYVNVSSSYFKSVRKIEHDVWQSYVDGHDTTDLVAYHYTDTVDKFKDEENKVYLKSSELFTKFQVERSVLLSYITFTIILGALGSFLASYVCHLLNINI